MSSRSTYRSISFMLSVVLMLVLTFPISEQAYAQANMQPTNATNGLFQHAYTFELQDSDYEKLKIGDLDNNKIKDFVVLTGLEKLVVYKNYGDGTSTREAIAGAPLYGVWNIQISDLNGDQNAEILLNTDSGILIYGLNADGKYHLVNTVATKSYKLIVLDFNNDGMNDIIAGNSSSLHYLKGGNDYTFTEIGKHQLNPAGTTYYPFQQIVAGDWNNDGFVDYAALVNISTRTYIVKFVGYGDGTFQEVAPDHGMDGIRSLQVADVDNDGYDDLIYDMYSRHSGVSIGIANVNYGDAAAPFTRNAKIKFDHPGYGVGVRHIGKLNADEYPDFVIGNHVDAQISWNDKGQLATPPVELGLRVDEYTDFDGDGRSDLIHKKYPHVIHVYLNKILSGSIQFESSELSISEMRRSVRVKVVRTGKINRPTSVTYETKSGTASAGIDYSYQRGTLEFRAGETEKWISVPLLGSDIPNEGRSFSIRLYYPNGGEILGTNRNMKINLQHDQASPPNDNAPFWPKQEELAVRDVSAASMTLVWPKAIDPNGIAAYEIREVNQALAPVSVAASVYSHTWTSGLQAGKTYHFEVHAKDTLNHVNEPLSAAVTIPANSTIPEPTATYHLKPYHQHKFGIGIPFIADVDGNGIDDFISNTPQEPRLILSYMGGEAVNKPFLGYNSCEGVPEKRVNLNHNRKDDIIFKKGNQLCIAETGNSEERFEKKAILTLPSLQAYVLEDFTKDGVLDLLYSTTDSKLVLLQGGPNYSFTEVARSNTLSYLYKPTAGDFNKDGHLDIVAPSNGGITLIYTNQGDGTFIESTELPHLRLSQIHVADFDRDGFDDIGAVESRKIHIYYGDATSSFVRKSAIEEMNPYANLKNFLVIDYNFDGHQDIFYRDFKSFKVAFNEKGNFAAPTSVQTLLSDYADTAVGEFTGDGKNDVSIISSGHSGKADQSLLTADHSASKLQFEQAAVNTRKQDGHVQLVIKRTIDRQSVTSVTYQTEDGTGVAGVDYEASTGVLKFAAGETEKTIRIPMIGNDTPDADRSFTVKLHSPTRGAKLGEQSNTVVTIRDKGAKAPQWPVGATLKACGLTPCKLKLSWPLAVGDGAAISHYEIREMNGALPAVTVTGNVYTYSGTGLQAGKTYQFEVKAIDTKGLSSVPLMVTVILPNAPVPRVAPSITSSVFSLKQTKL
ncbi:FG-GAP-like repeat-containing protein [Paenibacillus sp. SC116]|uniref:FG-GAP-like repeat-containing protein n=1 Tax=Paenibacillus sp. SC116 TaxID=2968986 RepID=UPI00215A7244|nr:FG-GAP-like repeat-containing protein [Paenibacillus sp. SC116]MCR8843959.1 FG-GAP-like repeat-containing protein [Paenibacillus sp. SC116]